MISEPVLIEKNENNYRIYNSLVVDHKELSVLSSSLSKNIISELSKNPSCAMDIVRKLNFDKQKVYYHLKKLEESGFIKLKKNEQRHGMTAKVYEAVAPVISTKLYDDFREHDLKERIEQIKDSQTEKFLHPFIEKGKLNSRVIFGDPYPHGKYDKGSTSQVHGFEFAMLLGSQIYDKTTYSHNLDTETRHEDLNENLIIIGNPKGNTITDKLNSSKLLPIYFDHDNQWSIVSKATGKSYGDARNAVIVKCDNPFNKNKKILLLAGIRTRGMRAVSIALVKHMDKIIERVDKYGNVVAIIEGLDKDGDMVIDSVNFLE